MKILAQAVGLVLMMVLTIFVGVAPETLMYVR